MAESVRDVMTPNPITISSGTTVTKAAKAMRDADVGNVLVLEGEQIMGILTDRDIVIRCVAEGKDCDTTSVGEICTKGVETVTPTDDVSTVIDLMRERAIRRVPVLEGDKPVGIVAIGDLAIEKDPKSALADISAQVPNR